MKNLVRDIEAVQGALCGRPVIYWEGDPWGPGKSIPPEMSAWLQTATHVFSVGGSPQVELLQKHGAKLVHHTIHGYDQILFADSERGAFVSPDVDVAFLGRNLSIMPVVSGLPGSMGRWRLVTSLQMRFGKRFILAGSGWPKRKGHGRIDFGEQDRFMQRARLLANWDHYPKTSSYTSDRLAIAMISGRPQVTTLHPEMDFLPGPEVGLFLEPTVGAVVARVRHLLNDRDVDLAELGRASHVWARGRLSQREAMRHLLSVVLPEIHRPPAEPWDSLPGPWPPGGSLG